MKKHKRSLGEALADSMGFPDTLSPAAPDIHIIGTREVAVDGCHGILAYEREEIRLRLKGRILCVRGWELGLRSYYTGHVSVKGRISSLSFEEGAE